MPRAPHPILDQISAAAFSAGVTRAELAQRVGTTKRDVTDWFSGRKSISLRQLHALARSAGKQIVLVDHDEPAVHALRELTEALAERPVDKARVTSAMKRAVVFLRAEGGSDEA